MTAQEISEPGIKIETTKLDNGSIQKVFTKNGEIIKSITIPANLFTGGVGWETNPKTQDKTIKVGFISQADIRATYEEHDEPDNPVFVRNKYTKDDFLKDFTTELTRLIWKRKLRFLINPLSYLKRTLWSGYQMVKSLVYRSIGLVNCILSRVIPKKK